MINVRDSTPESDADSQSKQGGSQPHEIESQTDSPDGVNDPALISDVSPRLSGTLMANLKSYITKAFNPFSSHFLPSSSDESGHADEEQSNRIVPPGESDNVAPGDKETGLAANDDVVLISDKDAVPPDGKDNMVFICDEAVSPNDKEKMVPNDDRDSMTPGGDDNELSSSVNQEQVPADENDEIDELVPPTGSDKNNQNDKQVAPPPNKDAENKELLIDKPGNNSDNEQDDLFESCEESASEGKITPTSVNSDEASQESQPVAVSTGVI